MAIQALAYIAGREKALSYFLDQTGIAPQELKTRAGEPEVLAGVLDFSAIETQVFDNNGMVAIRLLGTSEHFAMHGRDSRVREVDVA